MKKITFARLIDRLINKFKLVRSTDEEFQLSETVVPITSMDTLISESKGRIDTTAVSATGWYLMETVPANKKWIIHTIKARVSSGTFTYGNIGIEKATASSAQISIKDGTTATSLLYETTSNLILEAGDKIYFYVDGYTGAGNAQIQMWYQESDAY